MMLVNLDACATTDVDILYTLMEPKICMPSSPSKTSASRKSKELHPEEQKQQMEQLASSWGATTINPVIISR